MGTKNAFVCNKLHLTITENSLTTGAVPASFICPDGEHAGDGTQTFKAPVDLDDSIGAHYEWYNPDDASIATISADAKAIDMSGNLDGTIEAIRDGVALKVKPSTDEGGGGSDDGPGEDPVTIE